MESPCTAVLKVFASLQQPWGYKCLNLLGMEGDKLPMSCVTLRPQQLLPYPAALKLIGHFHHAWGYWSDSHK